MTIYTIVLNWNGKEDTLQNLNSLQHVTTPQHIVVVDNGSSDGSAEAIKDQFPAVTVIETGSNLGYAEGNNIGIRYALSKQADYIFILNNDTQVEPTILDAFLKRPTAPIQGAKTVLMHNPEYLDHLGGYWNNKTGQFELVGNREKADQWTQPITLDYVCGVALFIHTQVFREVGVFDSRFFVFWEESDWCMRAKQCGFPSSVCPEAKVYHKVSASFTGGKPHTTYFWWRNRLLWIQLHCSFQERVSLTIRVLIPEILRTLKHYIIKSLFCKRTPKHLEQLKVYRSLLQGVKDYVLRRFGNGPSWIFQK